MTELGNVTIVATIAANSIVLGADTVGDYTSTIIAGTGVSSTGATSGEGIAHTLSITSLVAGDATVGALRYNGSTPLAGSFNGSTTTPVGTNRLNYSGILYPTSINLVGTADTASAASHYLTEIGSDGLVRPKTLSNVRSEVVTSAAIDSALGFTPADDSLVVNLAGAQNITGDKTFSGATALANVTLSGYLRGPAILTLDPAGHGNNTGTVVIAGNLQVDGTTTTINSSTVTTSELNITLAKDAVNSAAANGAGITIEGPSTPASLLYTHASGGFVFNKDVSVPGSLTGGGSGHDQFSDFVSNEHIDHTSVEVIAGTGLSGGGNIAASRTLTVAIDQIPEKSGAVTATDRLTGTSGTTNFTETISAIPLSIFSNDLTLLGSFITIDPVNDRVGFSEATPAVTLDLASTTDAISIPKGTVAERPTGQAGMFRYNDELQSFEGFTTEWGAIGGGGTNTFTHNSFTGDGSTLNFALSQTTEDEGNLLVFIEGVFQSQAAYSLSTTNGVTTLVFPFPRDWQRHPCVYRVCGCVGQQFE